MHKRNRLFVSIALLYGLLGGSIALLRLFDPSLIPGNVPRLHGHIMLLGFTLMMIYGIALHVLPRFGGFPLYSERMADWQLYTSNIGLPLMVVGWLRFSDSWVIAGGMFSYTAILLFGMNMILTVRQRRKI